MVGKRNQRGGMRNVGRGGGGGSYYRNDMSYQMQNQSMPSPWQNNRNSQQLSEMELELEMVKRKRQMLQEQRQLLEEQRQLQRMQNQSWDTPRQYSNHNQQNFADDATAYSNYYQPERRAPKRPAAQTTWQPAKKAAKTPNNRQRAIQKEIEQDVGPVDPPVSKKSDKIINEVFRGPDKMSPWARGRLEFCVGRLFQEVRNHYTQPPYNDLNLTHLKVAKEKVRQRLHKIMMNKAIQGTDEMMAMYRRVHPMSDEVKLLVETLKTDTPKKEASKEVKASSGAGANAKPNQNKVERKKLTPDQVAIQKAASIYMYKMLDSKLDTILSKVYKICSDEEAAPAPLKGEPAKTTAEGSQPENAGVVATEPAANAETDKGVATDAPPVENGNDNAEVAEKEVKPEEKMESEDKAPENELDQLIEPIVNRILKIKLRSVLPNYKELLLAIISRDPQMQELGMKAITEKPEIAERHKYKQLFFVKIMGRPMLPTRLAMQEFLAPYEVATIKKHRTIFNLLFVGVGSEEAREKLLAFNGQKINGKVLDIRASDKNSKQNEKKTEANGTAEIKEGVGKEEAESGTENKEAGDQKGTEESEAASAAVIELDAEIEDVLNASEQNDDDKVEEIAQQSEVVTIEDDGDAQTVEESQPADKASVEQPAASAADDQPAGIRTRRSSRLPQKN